MKIQTKIFCGKLQDVIEYFLVLFQPDFFGMSRYLWLYLDF